jgi:protein TonB
MLFTPRRTLVQALTVSLLIHAVLLVSVVRLFPVPLDMPATTISVVMNRASQGESAKSGSEPVAAPLATPARQPSALIRSASVEQIPVPGNVSSILPEADAQPLVREVGSAAQPSSNPAVGGAGSSPSVVAREGVSADDMRHYRLSLASAARRFKRYPALARERGWEGTAEIALNVSTLMPGPEAVLVRSSGRHLLDEQALEMIAQAARITSLPEGLKGRDFRVLLPVKFSLEGDQ